MSGENELVAENEGTSSTLGSSLATDVANLGRDLVTDNAGWTTVIDTALTEIDILTSAANPLGALIANGVGWLLEHIPGISDVWDKLMGDAGRIEQMSATWENIARSLDTSRSGYDAASGEIEQWTGPAAESYRRVAQAYSSALGGASAEAEGLAVVVQILGGLVATCKDVVYTLIADFVEFTVLPAILGAIATSWCTFGGSIAVAITYIEVQADIAAGQITIKITKTTEEITVLTTRVTKTGERLLSMKSALHELEESLERNGKLRAFLKDTAGAAAHGETESQRPRAVDADGGGSEGGGSEGGGSEGGG